MIRLFNCVTQTYDIRLLILAAAICFLGCFTTTSLLARATSAHLRRPRGWLTLAALVLGCTIWSLHFVAMLAFMPGLDIAYDMGLTALSALVASIGSLAALFIWTAPIPQVLRIAGGGVLLGLSVSAMHYVGVAAMSFAGFQLFDQTYVVASIVVSIAFSIVALKRASETRTLRGRLEVGGWLALAICGLHFIGMAAMTIVARAGQPTDNTVLGTTTLAVAVGAVSLAILVASLAATMIEQHLTLVSLQELGRMRLLSNLAHEVIFVHRNGVVVEVNSAGERLFRAPIDELIGRPVPSLFTEDSLPALLRRERCPALGRRPEEMVVQTATGDRVPVELSCQPIDYLGKPATAVALRDLTDRKKDEARILHLARHDALTNLPNRYSLQERLDIALDTAAKRSGRVALMYLDLDRFKPVNDLFGHAAGDALLVQVAKRILAELNPNDTLSRIGGDEFVMVVTDETRSERGAIVATRIIEALRRPFHIDGHQITIGASAGIALYPEDGCNADTLMRAADTAMYRVKEEGRGSLRFYEASMNAQLQNRLQLQQELAGAVERGEMVLHYQPMVNGVTGELETFEALIRWNHPRRGMVPPLEFISLAEETGLIDQIGQWVIETACRTAAAWAYPWRVSVNVSPRQFRHSDLCATIGAAIRANGLSPARIVIEVTEGILIDDAPQAVTTLRRLRDLGVRVALDDFGTGFSSLSYLQLFKFDKLKIDKSFVKRLGASEEALTLTRTIINLGHNLGLQVTAEGVETQDQLTILQGLGCDQIQGYFVGRPAPIDAFTDLDRLRTIATFGKDRSQRSA